MRRLSSLWGIIEVGKLLIQAKEALEHGEFMGMIEEELPFGDSTARYLMLTSQHPTISNREYTHSLPASWRTLSILAQLPEREFLKQLEGKISGAGCT